MVANADEYTSQFIHSLQVYQTVVADPMPEHDDAYRRDMRLAALVHDFGKLLTVFGERDEHVDTTVLLRDIVLTRCAGWKARLA